MYARKWRCTQLEAHLRYRRLNSMSLLGHAWFVPCRRGSGWNAAVETLYNARGSEPTMRTKVGTMMIQLHNDPLVCDLCLVGGLSEYVGQLEKLPSTSIDQQRASSKAPYGQSRSMCHTEHVYHRTCSHWGRERIVGEPCCRARIIHGCYTSCLHAENIGSVNSSDPCSQCANQHARGEDWKPFALVSNAGWARVQERLRQRSLGLNEPIPMAGGILNFADVDMRNGLLMDSVGQRRWQCRLSYSQPTQQQPSVR